MKNYNIKYYVADLETCAIPDTDPQEARVWLSAVKEIGDNNFAVYNSLQGLMLFMASHPGNYHFHNLQFDGGYIVPWLLTHEYSHTFEEKVFPGQFSTIITGDGLWYQIKICFWNRKTVTIQDSFKLFTMSEKRIARAFGLETKKGKIDYERYRPEGYQPQPYEIEYIKDDLTIIEKAIQYYHSQNMYKMTQSANALKFFKGTLPAPYKKLFPEIEGNTEKQIRQSYKGGFTYVNPEFKNKDLEKIVVYDENSMYPHKMKSSLLPFGQPIPFVGAPKYDPACPLYIIIFTCRFTLKNGFLPTIQIKNPRFGFTPTEYLTKDNEEEVTLCMTSVDFELFVKHYNPTCMQYHCGWKFQASSKLLGPYVDYWYAIKEQADREGNKGMRQFAKIMQNGLYGKFGVNPDFTSKYPYLDEKGIMRLTPRKNDKGEVMELHRKPEYIPLASFITAYARQDVITNAQKNMQRFCYADTDSLHLLGHEKPSLHIDPYELGAWKQDGPLYDRARYLHPKCYWEENIELSQKYKAWRRENPEEDPEEYEGETGLSVKCAGLNDEMKELLTWDNFHYNLSLFGKLQRKTVKNGVLLLPSPFTIN